MALKSKLRKLRFFCSWLYFCHKIPSSCAVDPGEPPVNLGYWELKWRLWGKSQLLTCIQTATVNHKIFVSNWLDFQIWQLLSNERQRMLSTSQGEGGGNLNFFQEQKNGKSKVQCLCSSQPHRKLQFSLKNVLLKMTSPGIVMIDPEIHKSVVDVFILVVAKLLGFCRTPAAWLHMRSSGARQGVLRLMSSVYIGDHVLAAWSHNQHMHGIAL